MCVIAYQAMARHGMIQMNLSAKNKVVSTDVALTNNNVDLVDMEDTDATRIGIDLLIFNYRRR